MSYAQKRIQRFTADWLTVVMVGLMAAFQVAVLAAAEHVAGFELVEPTQSADLTIGVELIAIAAVEIGAILLLWRFYKYIPEWWQEKIKTVLKYGFILLVNYMGYVLLETVGYGWVFPVSYAAFVGILRLMKRLNLMWIAFNGMAFALGVGLTVVAGFQIAPVVVLLIMAAFTVYDHVAVNLSDIMGEFVELSGSIGIPNFIVIPKTIRFDLDDFLENLSDLDEKDDNVLFMLGVGDLVFPAVLVVSTATALSTNALPVVGAVLGTLVSVVVLRDSLEHADGGLPALPWLNSGAIGGFFLGAFTSGIPILTVLGL